MLAVMKSASIKKFDDTGGPLGMRIQVMRILLMRLFKRFPWNSTYAIFQGKYSTYAEFIIKKFKKMVCLINHKASSS